MKKQLLLLSLLVSFSILPTLAQKHYAVRTKGYHGSVDAGGILGPSEDRMNGFTISTTHGYLFNPYFYLGAGVGIESYTRTNIFTIPIYADFRANFLDNWFTPYFAFRFGAAMLPNGYVRAHTYLNPSLGVSFTVSSSLALNVSVGYRGIFFIGYYDSEMANAASVKLGLEF